MEREGADIGALLTFEQPTRPMREEAASAGFYTSPTWNTTCARVQLLTIAELLDGKTLQYPHVTGTTFKRAPRAEREPQGQNQLPGV